MEHIAHRLYSQRELDAAVAAAVAEEREACLGIVREFLGTHQAIADKCIEEGRPRKANLHNASIATCYDIMEDIRSRASGGNGKKVRGNVSNA